MDNNMNSIYKLKKRVLLTGASGFIGSNVLKQILENTDWEVVCPVTFSHMGIPERIKYATGNIQENVDRISLVTCDLRYPITEIADASFGSIDYVINIASESHVARSLEYPKEFILNNVHLICNLLEWARTHTIEKFLHISTDEVYGPREEDSIGEWSLHLPSNPYSASKSAQESIIYSYWRSYNLPIAITNSMNVIGENQSSEKFTPLVIKKVLNGEKIRIHCQDNKPGVRSWLYAGNKASALLHLLNQNFDTPKDSSRLNKWNIAGDGRYSILEWASFIANFMNKELNYELVDGNVDRPGFDFSYSVDDKKLLSTGWLAPYDLFESLEKTVKWYLENPEWLDI